jgi:hypothetical protein
VYRAVDTKLDRIALEILASPSELWPTLPLGSFLRVGGCTPGSDYFKDGESSWNKVNLLRHMRNGSAR